MGSDLVEGEGVTGEAGLAERGAEFEEEEEDWFEGGEGGLFETFAEGFEEGYVLALGFRDRGYGGLAYDWKTSIKLSRACCSLEGVPRARRSSDLYIVVDWVA